MKKSLLIVLLLGIASLVWAFNLYSPIVRQQRVVLSADKTEFKLDFPNIIINSVRVFDDERQLKEEVDFYVDYESSKITFNIIEGTFRLEYLVYPENLKRTVQNYQIIDYADSTKIKQASRRKNIFAYDPNLQISGNKTISISVANNADFKLDQSLYLKIDGELGENLMISSQLSDSQSPISPEGDSRELSNLDKVFLKLYGKEYELSFGDLELDYPQTEFMNYSPKFEGFMAGWYPSHKVYGALAISKGERTTVQFFGIEAKQGPYYLFYENFSSVKVIPGSEKVFLNGGRMQRGDDYSIDYAEGSISFSNNHFISANTNIRVSFQYANEKFRQNMYLASGEIDLTDKLALSTGIIVQSDDKSNPLQISFSDSDIDSLQISGDGEAWGSGVFEAEDGEYAWNELGYYQYAADDSTVVGTHNISFTDVGSGNGDYEYDDDLNYYIFVGENEGDFLPIRELPVPKMIANYDLRLEYEENNYSIFFEGILSDFDENTFSDIEDDDNIGYGISSGINLFPQYEQIKPTFGINYQLLSSGLKTIAETTDARTAYEIVALPDSLQRSKVSAAIGLDIGGVLVPNFQYSQTMADGFAQQDYYKFSTYLKQNKFWPTTTFRSLKSKTKYQETISQQNLTISQQELNTRYNWEIYELGAEYLKRRKLFEQVGNSEIGLQNMNWKTFVGLNRSNKLAGELFFSTEQVDSLNVAWEQASKINTFGFNLFYLLPKSEIKFSASHREVFADSTEHFDMASVEGRASIFK
ncbi:MAG: hypothetical protein KAS49_08520, partial [Candidatus Cloacimonetes bacterium]|nr:hypothetical protein [Candidatus Cloacimonadota bacterium]